VITSSSHSSSHSSYTVTWFVSSDGGRPILQYEFKLRRVMLKNSLFSKAELKPLEEWFYIRVSSSSVSSSSSSVSSSSSSVSSSSLSSDTTRRLHKYKLDKLAVNSIYHLQMRTENEFGWSSFSNTFTLFTKKDRHHKHEPAAGALQSSSRRQSDSLVTFVIVVCLVISTLSMHSDISSCLSLVVEET